jgi:hypothetical protein
MEYQPITEDKKQDWIIFLEKQVEILNGQPESKLDNRIFSTPDGDVATGKDLVGNLLATLTNKPVTIN